jgi:hypothetical protein
LTAERNRQLLVEQGGDAGFHVNAFDRAAQQTRYRQNLDLADAQSLGQLNVL